MYDFKRTLHKSLWLCIEFEFLEQSVRGVDRHKNYFREGDCDAMGNGNCLVLLILPLRYEVISFHVISVLK